MLLLWFYLSEKVTMCDILAFAGSFIGVVFFALEAPAEDSADYERLD